MNEIIHPPHRCVISRCWLDRMIIAQVCLRLATIKDHSKIFKKAFCTKIQALSTTCIYVCLVSRTFQGLDFFFQICKLSRILRTLGIPVYLICSMTPKSFFQTPPLRDANLWWLVDWSHLISPVMPDKAVFVSAVLLCHHLRWSEMTEHLRRVDDNPSEDLRGSQPSAMYISTI